MKKLLYVTFILMLFNVTGTAQEELIAGELIINFTNRPPNWALNVKIEAYKTVWGHDHYITTNYPGGEASYSSAVYCNPCNHFSDLSWNYDGFEPVLSLGLYEVSIWESNNKRAWFFIDYRTSDLPTASSYGIDVEFDYNLSSYDLEIISPIYGQITNGSYIPIWETRETIDLQTDGLEDFWDNCLTVFKNGDDHPKFAWGPYPGFSNNYYKIYKKKETPNFVLYDSTTSTNYIDVNEEILSGPLQANEVNVYYRITSVGYPTENPLVPPYESGYSNSVDIRSLMPPLEKQGKNSMVKDNYILLQNYPNPFNPTTLIDYSLPENNFVSLKVFDILGREVLTLVNETKESGNHSVEFDASGLPSGVYIYKLHSGGNFEIRKMVLQK